MYPYFKKKITGSPNTKRNNPTIFEAHALGIPNFSLNNAISGDVIATEDVIPANKRRMNHIAPKIKPTGSFWKMIGMATKPKSKDPCLAMSCVVVSPRKATEMGMAIEPPKTTSANSLVADVDNPVRIQSSSFLAT